MKNWKKWTALLLCLCLCTALFAGCGAKEEAPAPEPQTAAPEAEAPVEEAPPAGEAPADGHVDVLRIGTTNEIDSLQAVSQSGMNYTGFCLGLLFAYDEQGNLIPTMLEDYEISEDNQSLTLVIPQGVRWHDGEPLTIEDVKFTFEYNRDTLENPRFRNVDGLEIQGEDTLVVHFAEGTTAFRFINDLSIRSRIYPEHIWKDVPDPWEYEGDDMMVGCGPYKLVEVDADARLARFEAVPDYWRGEVMADELVLKTYGSEEALVMGLANDEIDAMYVYSKPLSHSLYETAEQYEDLDLGLVEDTGNQMLMMGFRAAPTDDPAFREAISYAMDYEMLAKTVGGKYAEVGHRGVIPSSNSVYYNPDLPLLETDYEKAAQLLDEAGYVDADGDGWRDLPDGSPMEVMIVPQYGQSRSETNLRIGNILTQNFEQVQVKGVFREDALTSEEVWSQLCEVEGSYNIHLGYCTSGMASFIGVPSYLIDSSVNGWWGTCDDEQFLADYAALSTVGSTEEYVEIMQRLQQRISDLVIALPTCWEMAAFPYRTDRIGGWVNHPGEGVINCNTWYNLHLK